MSEISLLLHNIRSTYNVGAIFRTAEGFGVKELILSGYTPYPQLKNDTRLPHIAEKISAQIHKTALGAERMVQFRYFEDINEYIRTTTLPLIALEQAATATTIDTFTPPDAFTLILGEEVEGIEPRLLKKCSMILEIPMVGQKESFNVSVAAGIALYALTTSK